MVLVVGAAHMTQRGEDRDYNLKKDSGTGKNFVLYTEKKPPISQRAP
jgi:hypothetical protein